MDIIDELRAFVATAQTGSFTGAAQHLGMSNRLTSKYVAELETRLGVRLFQRTTRRVGLTPAGEDMLMRAPALLDDLDGLLADVAEGAKGYTGTIRISAPVTFGEAYVAGMLGRFGRSHPGISFDLRLNDQYVDLASEGIDIAFRIGHSDLLSLKTRKLGQFSSVAVASPAYLAEHGAPVSPDNLSDHACIIDTNRKSARKWVFRSGGKDLTCTVEGRFHVNSARAAVALAEAGFGIAYAPRFALCGPLAEGRLVPVLTEFEGTSGPISAVYLEGRPLPRKLRTLIDFAAEDIRSADIL